jgi:hypothetical protein
MIQFFKITHVTNLRKFRLSQLNMTTPKGGGFNDYNKQFLVTLKKIIFGHHFLSLEKRKRQ